MLAGTLTAVMVFALGACGSKPAESAASSEASAQSEAQAESTPASSDKPFKVGAVLAGGLGDMSLSDSVYNGLQDSKAQLGVDIMWIEPQEKAEFEGHFSELARSGEYDLIVGAGFDQGQVIANVAEAYPDQKFLLIDGSCPGYDNVASVEYANNERSFIVGCLAGLMTKTNKVGVVGGVDATFVHYALSAYETGARLANPDCEVVIKYTDSWSDTALAKEIAIAMYEDGCDIIYNQCGGAGLGIYTAAQEKNFYVIGTEMNQNHLCPDNMICSSLSLMAETVVRRVEETMKGNFVPGAVKWGFADEGVGYTFENSNVKVPDEVVAYMEDAVAKIVSGEYVVPATFEEVEPFLAEHAGK